MVRIGIRSSGSGLGSISGHCWVVLGIGFFLSILFDIIYKNIVCKIYGQIMKCNELKSILQL